MKVINCKTMRSSVLVAAGVMLLGVALLMPAMILPRPLPGLFVAMIYPGFAALLVGPAILFTTALVSLLPPVRTRLDNCIH